MYISKRVLYKGLEREKRKRIKQERSPRDIAYLTVGMAGLMGLGGAILFGLG